MSDGSSYRQIVVCPDHVECRIFPSERCSGKTKRGDRCKARAQVGSLNCGRHGGSPWVPSRASYRRGDPTEVEHWKVLIEETLVENRLDVIGLWGPISEEQVLRVALVAEVEGATG